MTTHGELVLLSIGIVLAIWILNLVRRDRLYVGYGVILFIAIVGVLVILVIPPLLGGITKLVGAIFPASALTLLALCFIICVLVYILTQITTVSNRLATAIQELALQRTRDAIQGLVDEPHARRPNLRQSG